MKTRTFFAANGKTLALAALSATLFASPVMAQYSHATIEEAVVLSADPVYRTVRVNRPVKQCWDEPVRIQNKHGYRSHTPKILGVIIGAAVGNEFGKGRGRDLATVAGAVLGGSIGLIPRPTIDPAIIKVVDVRSMSSAAKW